MGIWTPGDKKPPTPDVFVPCLEAILETDATIRSEGLKVKAYFFDAEKKMLGSSVQPEPAFHDKKTAASPFAKPVIFYEHKAENVFFRIPKSLLDKKDAWSAVVLFGDSHGVSARVFPDGPLLGYEFPEKPLVSALPIVGVPRAPIPEPVVEQVVHTRNPKHPKITLFLRFPNSIKDVSEVKGVLAMCLLANNVGEIRRKLEEKNPVDYGGLFQFADKRNLAILCWGAQTLWRPDASYDELERETNKELDKGFDEVAAAWERGVEDLHDKYGIPTRDFLLWGICASAQWAHRLVLRQPDHFLAAYIHIPSSFDKPTPDAAKVLWLLTSGELDGGYQHGVRWYADCRAAGYPIIYKAVMNLGHAGSPIADNLGLKFFDYALTLRDQRAEIDKNWAQSAITNAIPKPWPAGFRKPEFVGDYLNQEVFPYDKQGMVPEALRVPLPTKAISEAWNK
ncbi:MAG: hypothetical protein ACOYM3_09625 [Terrimicrobiaceae bacterium]